MAIGLGEVFTELLKDVRLMPADLTMMLALVDGARDA